MRGTGVLGTQVARRTQLNGPKRVANTAPGLHPPEPREGGMARPARSSWFREYPARQPGSGGGEAPGEEACPAGLQGSRCAGICNNNELKVKGH